MARISTKTCRIFQERGTPVKQRALIILVAILGATCIVLGIFLLRGGKQPETADPTRSHGYGYTDSNAGSGIIRIRRFRSAVCESD